MEMSENDFVIVSRDEFQKHIIGKYDFEEKLFPDGNKELKKFYYINEFGMRIYIATSVEMENFFQIDKTILNK